MNALSIIVPVLDEAAGLEACLAPLQPMRARGVEVIVVDGGSRDTTRSLAVPLADLVLQDARGRARQMNAGANAAHGKTFAFLHADTILPAQADLAIARAVESGARWGRFDVTIEGRPWVLKVVACMMNGRSRWTGIATGDQAIFVERNAFAAAGGFPVIPLMEDIAMSKRLKASAGRPACLRTRVTTSGRRFEARGPWRTIFVMWRLRLAYALGADPASLVRHYR